MQPSVDEAEERALKKRRLVLEVEQAEFALQQAREQAEQAREKAVFALQQARDLHHLQQNSQTLTLLESYEASRTIDLKTKQMLKDHALSALMPRLGRALLTNEGTEQAGEEDLTITEVMQELGVGLSPETKQGVGRIAARMYRDTYHEEPLKNKQVINGKEHYVAWYKRKHEDLLVNAVNEYKTVQSRKRAPGQLSMSQCAGFTRADTSSAAGN
eukprot:730798-Rhodomonas_salina.1